MRRLFRQYSPGFSWIALLIIIGLLGIIAAFALPGLIRTRMQANESKAEGALRTVSVAADPSTAVGYNSPIGNDAAQNANASAVPKISENESPRPADRVDAAISPTAYSNSFLSAYANNISFKGATDLHIAIAPKPDANVSVTAISIDFGSQGLPMPSDQTPSPDGWECVRVAKIVNCQGDAALPAKSVSVFDYLFDPNVLSDFFNEGKELKAEVTVMADGEPVITPISIRCAGQCANGACAEQTVSINLSTNQ